MPQVTNPSWPAVVQAEPYSYYNPAVGPKLSFGAAAPVSDIGPRSSEVGGVTYGLADQGDLLLVHYPAISHDGGRSWAIDGPVFYVAAADGTATVSTIAALSATTAYAWGSGNFIRWTTNGGRQWWDAFFPGSVDRLALERGTATVTLHVEGANEPTYLLGDDGRTWKLRP